MKKDSKSFFKSSSKYFSRLIGKLSLLLLCCSLVSRLVQVKNDSEKLQKLFQSLIEE